MRTAIAFVTLLAATATISLADQLKGWITDQQCATTGKFTGNSHKHCVESGQPVVFVNESDKKIYKVKDKDKDKVKEFIGQKVTLDGTASGDTIEVSTATLDKE